MNFESIPRRVEGRIGSAIRYFPELPSTNDYLLALHDPTEGLVVVADVQTAGRGRGTNRWAAAAAENLLFSFVSFLDTSRTSLSRFPLLTAVAVCEALDEASIAGSMAKWPNDIVMDDKKLCGILIETRVQGDAARIVTGIGLNVNQMNFPSDLREVATSIALETGGRVDRRLLFGRVLDSLNRVFLDREGSAAIDRYAARCTTIGAQIAFEFEGRSRTGRAIGIDNRGRLLIDEGGTTTAFFGSEVTHVRSEK